MNESFSIRTEWLSSTDRNRREDAVAAITIRLLEKNLTENYDTFDRRKKTSVALGPYPMAMWFASNWWRLRWEATPPQPTTDWRMSHMLSAAGHGYSWPTIGFQTDGKTIRITSLPTTGASDGASVIYPTLFSAVISAEMFEKEAGAFIEDCNDAFGDSDLHALWDTVQEEKADRELALFRQIEARLGFDAGEGPESAIVAIMEQAGTFGHESAQEVSTFLYNNTLTREEIQALEKNISGTGISIRDLPALRAYAGQQKGHALPWDFGYDLARQARKIWGIDGVFSTEKLCRLLDTSPDRLSSNGISNLGLGVKHDENTFYVALHKKHPTAQRFMAARLICDAITASDDDRLLPATPDKTARQKTQRAFAAELLCPIALIKEKIGTDYTNEDIWNDIAEDFNVSSLVVKSQLANNNLIPQFENPHLWFDANPGMVPVYTHEGF